MALDMSKITVSAFLKNANKGASARRCLFGPVNHEENARFLKEQLAKQERDSMAKWNFDFNTETPVSGKYQWQKMDDDDENQVPVAYCMPQISKTPMTPTKARVCQPLSFSARLNFNANRNVVTAVKKDIKISASPLKQNETAITKCECPSPAADRKSATTVPEINIVRDETPSAFMFTNSKSSFLSTSNAQTSSTSNSKSALSSSSSSKTSQLLQEQQHVIQGRSLKRKNTNNQTDITEFFQVKKSRNVLTASSAKRRLDL